MQRLRFGHIKLFFQAYMQPSTFLTGQILQRNRFNRARLRKYRQCWGSQSWNSSPGTDEDIVDAQIEVLHSSAGLAWYLSVCYVPCFEQVIRELDYSPILEFLEVIVGFVTAFLLKFVSIRTQGQRSDERHTQVNSKRLILVASFLCCFCETFLMLDMPWSSQVSGQSLYESK